MSYNITAFQVKKIQDLKIPIPKLQGKIERAMSLTPSGKISIHEGECCIIEGYTKDTKTLEIEDIQWYGEGSGTLYNNILEPILKESQGQLKVLVVWEGGDTIETLEVDNGKIIYTNI